MNSDAKILIWSGLGVLCLAALIFLIIVPLGVVVPDSVEVTAMSPDFWPLIVTFIAGLAGLSVAYGGYMDRKHSLTEAGTKNSESQDAPETQYRPFGDAIRRVIIVVAALFALYFTIPFVGIVAGSMILLVFLIILTGERRWKYILPIAVLLPLILYGFFVYVANVPMPIGIFEQFR